MNIFPYAPYQGLHFHFAVLITDPYFNIELIFIKSEKLRLFTKATRCIILYLHSRSLDDDMTQSATYSKQLNTSLNASTFNWKSSVCDKNRKHGEYS